MHAVIAGPDRNGALEELDGLWHSLLLERRGALSHQSIVGRLTLLLLRAFGRLRARRRLLDGTLFRRLGSASEVLLLPLHGGCLSLTLLLLGLLSGQGGGLRLLLGLR